MTANENYEKMPRIKNSSLFKIRSWGDVMSFLPVKGLSRARFTALTLVLAVTAAGAAFSGWTSQPQAAGAMSVLDQLQAKEEIRQQLVAYGLYAEGDGLHPRDTDAISEKIMAPDAVSQQFFYDGTPQTPPRRRDPRVKPAPQERDLSTVGMEHLSLGIYYDEVTPTTAVTRSQHMYIWVSKNMPGDPCNFVCGGQLKHIQLNNYFDNWIKTPQGWLKSKMVIRSIN
jgi:hypothetical protein